MKNKIIKEKCKKIIIKIKKIYFLYNEPDWLFNNRLKFFKKICKNYKNFNYIFLFFKNIYIFNLIIKNLNIILLKKIKNFKKLFYNKKILILNLYEAIKIKKFEYIIKKYYIKNIEKNCKIDNNFKKINILQNIFIYDFIFIYISKNLCIDEIFKIFSKIKFNKDLIFKYLLIFVDKNSYIVFFEKLYFIYELFNKKFYSITINIILNENSKVKYYIFNKINKNFNIFINRFHYIIKNAEIKIINLTFNFNNFILNFNSNLIGENSISIINNLIVTFQKSFQEVNNLLINYKKYCKNLIFQKCIIMSKSILFINNIGFLYKKSLFSKLEQNNCILQFFKDIILKIIPSLNININNINAKHKLSIFNFNKKVIDYFMNRGFSYFETKKIIFEIYINYIKVNKLFKKEIIFLKKYIFYN